MNEIEQLRKRLASAKEGVESYHYHHSQPHAVNQSCARVFSFWIPQVEKLSKELDELIRKRNREFAMELFLEGQREYREASIKIQVASIIFNEFSDFKLHPITNVDTESEQIAVEIMEKLKSI